MYRLPLPLRAWHNVAGVAALRGTPTTASLEIAYAAGNIKWATRGSVRDIESTRFRGRILGAATAIPSR
jgi:hypothetical protein